MIQKYGAALISIALVAFAFLKTAFAGDGILDAAEVWQLVALVAGAILTFLLPLVPLAWAGALKTGAAAVAALATAIIPFALQGTLTYEQIAIVALAVLNALGVEIGVQARASGIVTHAAAAGSPPVADPEGAKALRVRSTPPPYDGISTGLFE